MAMAPLSLDALPAAVGEDGVIRVSGTRVPLETVVTAFLEGSTAEEIAQQYSSIPLADVYQLIAYYWKHQQQLRLYLDQRRGHAEDVRQQNESRWNPAGIRERLVSRRQAR